MKHRRWSSRSIVNSFRPAIANSRRRDILKHRLVTYRNLSACSLINQWRTIMTHPISTETHGAILVGTLDRPKANAIDAATSREMGKVFQDFRDNEDLHVAIITGAGKKFFCAGWDLKAAAEGETPDSDYGVGGFGGLQELPNLNKPVIAAVNGMAVGGGFELALSADLIVAAEHVRFALPEISAGTLADAATIKLPRRIPYHVAMDMLLTGRWMSVDEAHGWGLVNEVVAAEKLVDRALEIAQMLSQGPALVFAAIKEVARETEHMPFAEALRRTMRREFKTVDVLYSSEDQLEGARAFAEKRKPIWRGR